MFSRSIDRGNSYSKPIDISDALSCGQEGSSHVATGPNGEVYAAWEDGCGNVMFDRSLDGGISWGTDIVVRTYPKPVNTFPESDDVRGNISLAVDLSSGPFRGSIYLAAVDVNGPSGGAADAWIVHSRDGGNTWSPAVLLSDGPRGPYKYYFQPNIAVAPNGRIDASWYDTRFNTSTDTNQVTYDFFYSYSVDGAATFAANSRVTDVSSVKVTYCATQSPCGQRVLYEYTGLASDANRVFPLWTDLRTGMSRLFTARIWQP
jgi:hypothetical protein